MNDKIENYCRLKEGKEKKELNVMQNHGKGATQKKNISGKIGKI